jgi:predicted O-linked N-acetylglucosamine transferase (SPINDLY family)
MSLQVRLQHALALHQRGHLAQAQSIYEQILREQPRHFDALHLLGVIAAHSGNSQRALEMIDKALEVDAGNAVAHFNRGTTLQTLKQWQAALACYNTAVAIKPDFAEAYSNRSVVQLERKQWQAALASCDRAIAIRGTYADAYFNRGNVYRDLKQWHSALVDYDRAVAIRSTYAEAFFNRGNVHRELEQWEATLADYDRAIACRPGYASAYYNRGNVLRHLKQADSALASYGHALALEPRLGFLLGEFLSTKMGICDWRDIEAGVAQLTAAIERDEAASNPFVVLALSESPALQKRAAQIWVRETSALDCALPAIPRHARHDRMRIGYFSADYQDHATSHLIAGLFEAHDVSRFQVTAFSFGLDSQGEMRSRLKAACESFIDVRDKTDTEVALLARDLKIDIAVDLNGFTQDNRTGIFALRAAPLQVNYLGYPGTMGAGYMDYLIADRTVVPNQSRRHYAEKIIYLPHTYQVNDTRRAIADRTFTRIELGLPPTGFVFCCFNNNYKITPDTFDRWTRILRRVDGSVLWLLEDNATAASNLRREAAFRNVSADRLVFAKRIDLAEHLARHRAADLFLDTLPYNAHTTASDALWAGVPVLTCVGDSFAARVAASLLTAVNVPELIASTAEQYEELATQLATDPQRLADLKQKLAANRLTTPLFDVELYARHVEAAYVKIYERYQADLPAEDVQIEPESQESFSG